MKNRAGFSLAEIMVAVAVIGILSAIAMPNYQMHRARTRQTGAKSELAGVFTIEQSFYAQYNTYHYELPPMGFVPEGVLNADEFGPRPGIARYYAVYAGVDLGGVVPPITTYVAPSFIYEPGTGFAASNHICSPVGWWSASTDATWDADTALGNRSIMTRTTFSARAIGCPRKNVSLQTALDRWSLDQNRVLTNMNSGF